VSLLLKWGDEGSRHSARKILRVLEGGKAEMETKRKHEPESSPHAVSEESPNQLKIKA
jgi:hypothetical protein